jgi:hypothetical protein
MLAKIVIGISFLSVSCSLPELQNAGDPMSLSGNFTKLLLDLGSENFNSSQTNSGTTNLANATLGDQTPTNNVPTYTVTIRVNNLAGISGTAVAQFSLNSGVAELVSTTGNAVRDLIFSTRVASGDPYLITSITQPNVGFRFCNIPNFAGIMPPNDLIVTVYCYGTNPSGGTSLTVSDVVGANAVQGFYLDGNPGGTVFVNLGLSGTAYAFDSALTSTATSLVFSTINYASVQNVSVYRAQTGISAQLNVTHGFAPFTQFASVSVTP